MMAEASKPSKHYSTEQASRLAIVSGGLGMA